MILSKIFTASPYSKFIILFLFILLPIVGFYLGLKYQEKIHPQLYPKVINISKEVYPECIAGLCPTYKSVSVTDTFREDTVITIPTAMTQGAGKIVIIENGKKIFDSGEMAGIGFEQLKEGNGFILKYSSPRDVNFNSKNYEVKYIWEHGKFVQKPEN